MFDYRNGVPANKFKIKPKDLLPKLSYYRLNRPIQVSLALQYLEGFETTQVSRVCKTWYSAFWDPFVIMQHCEALELPERQQLLLDEALKKTQKLEKDGSLKNRIKWRYVYCQLLYNTCFECGIPEKKMRFLPLLKRTLCYSCAKLPKFEMVSLESAELDYGVTRKQVLSKQIPRLKVLHPSKSGKYMFVCYKFDLKTEPTTGLSCSQEKRKAELIYYLKKEGITQYTQLRKCVGESLNYIQGKTSCSAKKLAKKLAKKPQEPLQEARKQELLGKLSSMKVDIWQVDTETPGSLAFNYIHGKTTKQLNWVAGSIWRKLKPSFSK